MREGGVFAGHYSKCIYLYCMNNQQTTSPLKIGLVFMQSHLLRRTCFSEYQANTKKLCGYLQYVVFSGILIDLSH